MSTTLQDIIDAVNARLSDFHNFASFSGTGDGVATTFKLEDAPIVPGSESVIVDSVMVAESTSYPPASGTYYLSEDSGWLVFGTAPGIGSTIAVHYRYKIWSDAHITEAINTAIDYLFPDFRVVSYDDDTVTDGVATEYPLPPDTARVVSVYHSSTNTISSRWCLVLDWDVVPHQPYTVTADTSNYLSTTTSTRLDLTSGHGAYVTIGDVLKDSAENELVRVTEISGDTLTVTRGYRSTTAVAHSSAATWERWGDRAIRFAYPPPTGYLRLRCERYPQHMSSATDTLEYTVGIPARAKEPIILYACWYLLSQRVPVRIRDDVVSRAAGEYVISPQQIQQAAAQFKMMLDMHVNRLRMRPFVQKRRK